jgi:hypothetical protein
MRKLIPRDKFLKSKQGGFAYITDELLKEYHTEGEIKNFDKWITGQTCALIDGKCAIYSWDYERWVGQGKKTDQNVEDWD